MNKIKGEKKDKLYDLLYGSDGLYWYIDDARDKITGALGVIKELEEGGFMKYKKIREINQKLWVIHELLEDLCGYLEDLEEWVVEKKGRKDE
jgi:hypothetical protein